MSGFGDAAAVTPELNHAMMAAGDLGESLVQAAAGYESVADMLIAELTAMSLNTSTTAMVAWQGPGGAIYEMTAEQFCAVCGEASAWVRVGQIQAAEVAAAHNAALEMMIPAPACLANRASQAGLVASNVFGQNTPGIIGLDAQYYGHFWVTNATARTGYGQVVSTALGALSAPPPLSPIAPDPAAPAAGAAEDATQSGAQGGLQVSAQTMNQTAGGSTQAMSTSGSAGGAMGSMGSQLSGVFGQAGSAVGELSSVGQGLPSMLGQAPSMLSGMLGPLSSMSGANGVPAGAAGAMGPEAAGALSGLAGGGGALAGGGGSLMSAPSVASSFVRPANSFSSPNAPTLPGGWQGGPESESQTRPAGVGGGGLFGAPGAMGREGTASESAEKSKRTLQVSTRSGAGRGERQRI